MNHPAEAARDLCGLLDKELKLAQARIAQQDKLIADLSDRLAACSEVLGKRAEGCLKCKGKL